MSSVQREQKCPKCNFLLGLYELNCRSFEEWFFCARCGYSYRKDCVFDVKKGEKKKAQVEKLVAEGNLNEAIKVGGQDYLIMHTAKGDIPILEWSDEEKLKHLKSLTFDRYYLLDAEGKRIFEEKEAGDIGSWRISEKGKIGAWTGSFSVEGKGIWLKDVAERKDTLTMAKYTEKIGDEWYLIDALNDKKDIFPADIDFDGYNLLMKEYKKEIENENRL